MKIGELARRLGTTPRTLRFYEELGLFTPTRSGAGTRYYDDDDLERLRAIRLLIEAGMTLTHIEGLARVRSSSGTGDQASHTLHEMLGHVRAKVKKRKETLERLETDLVEVQGLVERCFGCQVSPNPQGCAGCNVAAEHRSAQILRVIW